MSEPRPAWTYESIGARWWWMKYQLWGVYFRWKYRTRQERPAMYVVRINDAKTRKPVKYFTAQATQTEAEKLERGVLINLDRERFFTDIEYLPPGSRNGV